ncbi:hypothetical protein PYCCODRAFT_1130427 [Trametes coccinea BRFM310]|uniref:DUF6699 domain-containing protein n=1 Tax=Trametes coccinea (strain BRFM310) TaxID=1353009 RepID=A0A1Y2I8P9_TRAC3|nr:hypothetical protein PYCCODRAFT_1130427 [Trametes coccinea BRFM310]
MLGKLSSIVSGIGTPRAPKKGTVPLPDAFDSVPPLVPSGLSSASSDASSLSPTTPSPRSSPVARRAVSKLSDGGYGSPKDAYKHSRFSTPDPALDKPPRASRVSSPAPQCQVVRPKPRRAWVVPPSEPVTVMAVAIPPPPDASQVRKGILKGPRPATAAPPESHRSMSPLKPSRPKSTAPPPRISCSASPLHWLLSPPIRSPRTLPGGKLVTKQVIFDATKPTSLITLRDLTDRSVIKGRAAEDYLSRLACAVNPLKEMTLVCLNIPGFEIPVKGKDGDAIRCLDVFKAIYDTFDKIMSPADRERNVAEAEKRMGMRFVDLLEGNSYFLGLTIPPQGSALDRDGRVCGEFNVRLPSLRPGRPTPTVTHAPPNHRSLSRPPVPNPHSFLLNPHASHSSVSYSQTTIIAYLAFPHILHILPTESSSSFFMLLVDAVLYAYALRTSHPQHA